MTLLCGLSDEIIRVKGVCPRQNGGLSNRVGWAEEREFSDKLVLRRRQDEPEVAVLESSAGTLD